MSTEYPPNVCRISTKCLSNIRRMSVEYLTTISDTSYVNISAECLSNICRMPVEYLSNVCRISDNYVRHLFETSDSDLDLQGQICHESLNICVIPLTIKIKLASKLQKFLKKKLNCFHCTFKLEVRIDHRLVLTRGAGWGQGGGRHLFFANAKRPSLV